MSGLPQFDWIAKIPSYATVPASARNDGAADQEVKERAAVAGVGFRREVGQRASRGPGSHRAFVGIAEVDIAPYRSSPLTKVADRSHINVGENSEILRCGSIFNHGFRC